MSTQHTVGIVLAAADMHPEVLRQVAGGTMFPAQPGTPTHIPVVGDLKGEDVPVQALVDSSFIYELTKGNAEMVEVEGTVRAGTHWPAHQKPVVHNVWSHMLTTLNDDDQRMECYDCSYTTTFYPGRGLSSKVRINVYEMTIGSYNLKVHYITRVWGIEETPVQ